MLGLEHLTREGPLERLGQHFVEVADEVQDLGPQVVRGGEAASANDAPDQNAEPNLDLVQPRRMLRGVHKADAMTQVTQERLAALPRLKRPALAPLHPSVNS